MSTYVTAARCKYEVSERKLDEAIEWLKSEGIEDVRHAAAREHTSVLYPEDEGWFGGNVPYRWVDSVAEFMERFCLPGSYATFREDEEYCWSMAVLNEQGKVEWESIDWDNPFEAKCDEMDGRIG